jgi:hypothetical protein
MLVFFNPVKFGITFTFGNLLSLGRFVIIFLCCMLCCLVNNCMHMSYVLLFYFAPGWGMGRGMGNVDEVM